MIIADTCDSLLVYNRNSTHEIVKYIGNIICYKPPDCI